MVTLNIYYCSINSIINDSVPFLKSLKVLMCPMTVSYNHMIINQKDIGNVSIAMLRKLRDRVELIWVFLGMYHHVPN